MAQPGGQRQEQRGQGTGLAAPSEGAEGSGRPGSLTLTSPAPSLNPALSPPPCPATWLCPPPEQHPHSINGPTGWGHRAQGPTSLPRVLVAVACPAPRHGLLRRSWGPRWPAGCPQWPPCPVGLRPLAQAGRACWGLLAPWMPPSCPAQNSPPGLFRAVSASGPTRPPQLRFSSGRGLPRESAEASEPPAAASHHARGAGGADPGSAPSLAGARSSPLWLLQGHVACRSSPPCTPPPHPSRSVTFHPMETLSSPSGSLSHLGETEVQAGVVGWRGDPPGSGREGVPLGSAAPAGPCGQPAQASGSGREGLTSARSCWPWASCRTSCSSPRSRLSSASRTSRACVTRGALLSRLGALTRGSAGRWESRPRHQDNGL